MSTVEAGEGMKDYLITLRDKMRKAVAEANKATADFKRADEEILRSRDTVAEIRIGRRDSQTRKDAAIAWDHWAAEATMWAGVINAECALMRLDMERPVGSHTSH
jgi:hypothetical protein